MDASAEVDGWALLSADRTASVCCRQVDLFCEACRDGVGEQPAQVLDEEGHELRGTSAREFGDRPLIGYERSPGGEEAEDPGADGDGPFVKEYSACLAGTADPLDNGIAPGERCGLAVVIDLGQLDEVAFEFAVAPGAEPQSVGRDAARLRAMGQTAAIRAHTKRCVHFVT